MEIDYIKGPKTDKIFGMSKYQMEIVKRLNVEMNVIEFDSLMTFFEKKYFYNSSSDPSDINNRSKYGKRSKKLIMDMGKKTLKNIDKYRYIKRVKNKIKNGNIKHITTQEQAYIQNSLEMDKTIITCHDLIPWVYENDRSKFWKDNINGLKKADTIITVSEFSKNEIIKNLNYPEENIQIVMDGVDHNRYYENRDKNILKNLNISVDQKVVLYVGSEMPRMNFSVLVKAFAKLKKKIPDVKLVKIGESQSFGSRENLLKLIIGMNLQNDIFFVGYVPEEYMPKWYNAADVLAYPCAYAGFGLPPLEAMACGTPVITSNTSSLPEVVDDAGIMVDPSDVDSIYMNMFAVLTQNELSNDLAKKGLKRAKLFTWANAAKGTYEIYDSI